MARTHIEFPGHVDFSTSHTLVIGDINRANHLGVDRLFALITEVQLQFFEALEAGEPQTLFGAGYIMADSEAVYLGESQRGDRLVIDVAVCNFTSKGFEVYYRVQNETRQRQAALVKTGMVCLDVETGKPTQVPRDFTERYA